MILMSPDPKSSSARLLSCLTEPYNILWAHRLLLYRVVKTTLLQRYAGSLLGASWLIIGPLLLLCTYIFMFVVVLGVRIPNLSTSQYVVHMVCGFILFLVTSQALTSATSSLSQEPGLLFNQVFPAELFPVREVLAAAPLMIFGTIAAIIWAGITGSYEWAWLLLPPLFVLTLMAMVGCAWFLSLANLVVRDTSQILVYILMLLMLTSPIAYEADMLPSQAKFLIDLNPFAYFVRTLQTIIVHGHIPGSHLIIGTTVTGLSTFHGAFCLFKRGKSVIAENI